MRTVHIVLLVLAGALAGAVVMRVAQRPVRVAMRPIAPLPTVPAQLAAAPVRQHADAQQSAPLETRPAQTAETQSVAQPNPLETPAPAREAKLSTERKPSPMHRAPAPVPVAVVPHSNHTPPQRVELQASAQPGNPEPVASPASPSPPVSPEQPKETPPARLDPKNATSPPAPTPSAPEPNQATLNAGMLIPVRLLDSLSSERNHAGDAFAATLDRELVANGFVIAERGARVEGRVTAADRGARTLSLELTSVHSLDNQDVTIETDRFDKQSEPDHSQAATKIGAGAIIGAVIGGIAGGGKGAAIGAGAGGGIGVGDVVLSRKPAALGSETRLTFRLRAPVTLVERIQ